MRCVAAVAVALVGLPPLAAGQRLDFVHRMVPAARQSTVSVAFGDLDGDGDLDAIVGDLPSAASVASIAFLRNEGTGSFRDATAANLPFFQGPTQTIALGDVDGDGDLDAFLGISQWFPSPPAGTDRLLVNDGFGVFTDVTTSQLPTSSDPTRAAAFGDVDGDGDLDVFLGKTGAGFVPALNRLLLNDGTGVFLDATSASLPAAPDRTADLALEDLDGDGDLDAFLGNLGQDRLYRNDGTGVFTDSTATDLPALADDTFVLVLGDVDGDGDLDVILGNCCFPLATAQDRLLRNDGTGVFTEVTATSFPSLLDDTWALALADVDGDGDLDLLRGIPGQNRLSLNDGSGVFTDFTGTHLPATGFLDSRALALEDVDTDGDPDAFLGNFGHAGFGSPDRQNRLYLNDGAGVFADVTGAEVSPFSSTAAIGDVDGDGDLDAILGRCCGGQDTLLLNDGDGNLADVTTTHLPSYASAAVDVELADVDGDGDLDAYVGNLGLQDRLLVNDGTGVFLDATASSLPPGATPTHAVDLGDVDGDGDPDAFLGSATGPRLYENDGTGAFSDVTAARLPAIVFPTSDVVLGDVDGDGDLDALLGSNLGFTPTLVTLFLRNDGTGAFADVSATHLPAGGFNTSWTEAVALADVDGDGDLDAYIGTQQDRLWRNDGTGVFTDVTTTSLPAFLDTTFAVAFGDLEGDGDLDAFVGTSAQDRLLLNDGTGVFTDGTATGLPRLSEAVADVDLGDMDGDGDLDVYVGGAPDRLYFNRSRHLSWRAVPRVGKPLTFDVSGPPNGLWLLAVSLGSASVPIPPLGSLGLDPSTAIVARLGTFGAQVSAAATFAVPASPSLVGVPTFWQALVAFPPRLTNLEVATATNL